MPGNLDSWRNNWFSFEHKEVRLCYLLKSLYENTPISGWWSVTSITLGQPMIKMGHFSNFQAIVVASSSVKVHTSAQHRCKIYFLKIRCTNLRCFLSWTYTIILLWQRKTYAFFAPICIGLKEYALATSFTCLNQELSSVIFFGIGKFIISFSILSEGVSLDGVIWRSPDLTTSE